MSNLRNTKGFTLIELLIVIVIIGILAVAFLPTLLGAPEKARDTKRVADVQKIQKVLIEDNLSGQPYPTSSMCITAASKFGSYTAAFGGQVPTDPVAGNSVDATLGCPGGYYFQRFGTSDYSFGVFARVEDTDQGNIDCDKALAAAVNTTPTTSATGGECYAVLVE